MFWPSKSGINSNYSFSSSPTFTAEPWCVHTGRPKSSSSNAPSRVSVFIFDKKQFENYLLRYGIIKSKSSSRDKHIIQEAYEVLKSQVNNLAKLKHPNILTLVEPIEEHSKNFMFVTEYVSGCLATVFQETDEEEDFLTNSDASQSIVIQRGVLQISQGLDFIHNRASSVHLDLQPRSIFINENSDWKISGLGHLMKLPHGTNTAEYFIPQYDPRVPTFMHLDLNYSAPEIVFENALSPKNDYFSLGLLIFYLYYRRNLLNCENSTSYYKDEYTKFERKLGQRSWDNVFSKVPSKLRFCLPKLMNRDIFSRYDNITDFIESDFFQNSLVKTLVFLDDLPTKSTEERIIFLEGLVDLLPQFPTPMLQRKFLPVLVDLLDQTCASSTIDTRCINTNLHIVIRIGSTLSQLTFHEKVYPHLVSKSNFKVLLENATSALIENLEVLKDKFKSSNFVDQILKPLFTYVLSGISSEKELHLQESILTKLNLALACVDFPTAKNFFFPLVSQLFTKTTSLTIKTACVSSFQMMIEEKAIDKYLIVEELLPLIKSMKTRDSRILLKFLQLFKTLPDVVDDETVIVSELLPLLWNFSMAMTLKPVQYSEYVAAINSISSNVQKKHMAKLKQTSQSEALSENNDFNKIIEKPVVKKEDPDTAAARNISVPAIQPIRANSPSTKVPTPARKNNHNVPIMTSASSAKKSEALNSPTLTPRKPEIKHAPKPLVLTKGISVNKSRVTRGNPPKAPKSRTILNKDTNSDEFDDFVSSTPSPVSNYSTVNTAGPTNSLPPGFSMPLQPSRKPTQPSILSPTSADEPSLL